MKAAIIAIEDRRFDDEGAVDPRGVLRALVNNAAGGDTQGASTITQQYVKNLLINRGELHPARSRYLTGQRRSA